MPKKIYHLPIHKAQEFISNNRLEISQMIDCNDILLYNKTFGKAYYELSIKRFIEAYKIEANRKLKALNYFKSKHFFELFYDLLNLEQFSLNTPHTQDLIYGIFYLIQTQDLELFDRFCDKVFLHYFGQTNTDGKTNKHNNIKIDYQNISQLISSQLNISLKESFGEDGKDTYFKIYLDDKLIINLKGKSIKTLRKKAYKKALLYLITKE